jgi:hypothetical protein
MPSFFFPSLSFYLSLFLFLPLTYLSLSFELFPVCIFCLDCGRGAGGNICTIMCNVY